MEVAIHLGYTITLRYILALEKILLNQMSMEVVSSLLCTELFAFLARFLVAFRIPYLQCKLGNFQVDRHQSTYNYSTDLVETTLEVELENLYKIA